MLFAWDATQLKFLSSGLFFFHRFFPLIAVLTVVYFVVIGVIIAFYSFRDTQSILIFAARTFMNIFLFTLLFGSIYHASRSWNQQQVANQTIFTYKKTYKSKPVEMPISASFDIYKYLDSDVQFAVLDDENLASISVDPDSITLYKINPAVFTTNDAKKSDLAKAILALRNIENKDNKGFSSAVLYLYNMMTNLSYSIANFFHLKDLSKGLYENVKDKFALVPDYFVNSRFDNRNNTDNLLFAGDPEPQPANKVIAFDPQVDSVTNEFSMIYNRMKNPSIIYVTKSVDLQKAYSTNEINSDVIYFRTHLPIFLKDCRVERFNKIPVNSNDLVSLVNPCYIRHSFVTINSNNNMNLTTLLSNLFNTSISTLLSSLLNHSTNIKSDLLNSLKNFVNFNNVNINIVTNSNNCNVSNLNEALSTYDNMLSNPEYKYNKRCLILGKKLTEAMLNMQQIADKNQQYYEKAIEPDNDIEARFTDIEVASLELTPTPNYANMNDIFRSLLSNFSKYYSKILISPAGIYISNKVKNILHSTASSSSVSASLKVVENKSWWRKAWDSTKNFASRVKNKISQISLLKSITRMLSKSL